MSRLTIDLGTAGNPATGDSIRTAFNKVNTNFSELYAELGGDSLDTLSFTNNTISSGITNGTLVLEGNGTGAVDIEGIQVNDNQIITTTTNANLLLDGNGTGTVVINGLSFPIADGTAGQVLKTDGSGNLSFTAVDPGAITIVGDDSTGTAVNIGETFKIAGSGTVTTAVSGDTLTITGPNLSSYLTAVPKTIDVNEISSGDSSAIQINDAINVSGADTFHGSVRFNAGYTEKINALTSSSTITVNCATASIHTVTLAVSTGFVISNLPTGGTVTLIITQGGSGSYTATFGTDGSTTVKFPGGAPTLSTAVSSIDVVTIFNDGTNYLGNIAKAYA